MDIRDVEVETGGDLFGRFTGVDDPPGDVMDAYPPPLDTGGSPENRLRRNDLDQTIRCSVSRSNLWSPRGTRGSNPLVREDASNRNKYRDENWSDR